MTVEDIVSGLEKNMVSDGGADYIMLYENTSLITTIVNLIAGIVVTIIVIGMPIIIAIELCYINFPLLQDEYNKIVLRSTGRINGCLSLTIRDAKKSIELANTIKTGVSANYIYLTIKIKVIFLSVFTVGIVLGIGPMVLKLIWSIAAIIINGFSSLL